MITIKSKKINSNHRQIYAEISKKKQVKRYNLFDIIKISKHWTNTITRTSYRTIRDAKKEAKQYAELLIKNMPK